MGEKTQVGRLASFKLKDFVIKLSIIKLQATYVLLSRFAAECNVEIKKIFKRWQAWEKFGREVSEKPVMFSDDGILKDFMPGNTLFFFLLLLLLHVQTEFCQTQNETYSKAKLWARSAVDSV